jgi:endoribonuclease LACTB2
MSRIIDAVSVVLTHGDQVFTIQRQYFLKSFPGYWAFPGGKVEAQEVILTPHPLTSSLEPKLWAAVVRETQEELAFNLEEALAKDSVHAIHFLGLAVTPEFNPYRFATHFFKIELKEKPEFMVDRGEALSAEWTSCHDLLQRFDLGELLAVPPVMKVIKALGLDIHTTHVGDLNIAYDAATEVPMIESLKGVRQYLPLSHTVPPANRTNCFLIGDADHAQILLDPSPQDESELKKLIHALRDQRVSKIMLTHHHPDHHEHAPQLARFWDVPIMLSADSRQRLERIRPDYFAGIKLEEIQEGMVLTQWLGHSVRVVAVPGHDEGQLALMPGNRAWFLAGDLFQGIGTVVIGAPEGDMAKYMRTLEKVILLAPRVIFPSHGIGLGSTFILEKTLEHRKLREEQVLAMSQQGKSEDEVLLALYSDLQPEFLKYARKNIQAHLKKLRDENRV